MFAFIVIVSVWTPLEFERIGQRWFSWPHILCLSPVPAATAFFVWACWRGLHRSRFMFSPFYRALALVIIASVGLVISTFPYIVAPSITVWDAAAAASPQRFVLAGIAILLPFILGYTVFAYYRFRGKVRADEGYHQNPQARGSMLCKWRVAEIHAPSHPKTMPPAINRPSSCGVGPTRL
jgi:cytochrome d ubiquinol oxidase subunit II